MAIDKKEHIINAAIELFSKKGFEGTSIRDLAALAEVNVAMVNYYFGSKDKLFEAMVEYKSAYLREMLEEIQKDDTQSAIEKMDAIIEAYVNKLLKDHQYHRVIHQELMLLEREVIHQNILEIFKKNREIIQQIIEEGIQKKEFKPVNIGLTWTSIIGTINQVLLSKKLCHSSVHAEKEFDPYTDEPFRQQLIDHIQQLMHAHLLN